MTEFASSYADLEVGQVFRSEGRTLTEMDLSLSCMVSGDWHPIHADKVYAATTKVEERIFQGAYGILVALGIATRLPLFTDTIIGALGLREWSFRSPLRPGDTIKVEAAILNKRLTSDGRRAIIERSINVTNQNGDVVQDGIIATMVQLEGQQ